MRARTIGAILGVLGVLVIAVPVGGQEADDTIFIAKDDEQPSNAEIAARLSEGTFATADRVVLARDDDFADALAAGVLQQDAPRHLVSRDGMQPRVAERLGELAPQEVVLLGGEAALPAAIADDLTDRGYAVSRREGPSRFETAVAIAERDAPDATAAILVRAFPAADSTDPTRRSPTASRPAAWPRRTAGRSCSPRPSS